MDLNDLAGRRPRTGRIARLRHTALAGLLILDTGCAAYQSSSMGTLPTPPMIGTMADPAAPGVTAAESSLAAHARANPNPNPNPNPGRVEITFDDHAIKTRATESTLLMETDPNTLAAQPPSALPAFPSHYPIDLTSALRLAEVENPVIAGARTQISAALAERKAAYALLLPALRVGNSSA